ncbi:MAG: glycerol-3-phosphate acyltransferase [Tractidigestivibacter sp.]|jgi:glycerol-3-phosphate acyltransferase PlsY|uniref:glycerol-3-phosphate acyltransferase n=1 Tax=Tractidigestivibacter sp. TaxID=2847320 RepID=UPI003D8E434D
MYEFWCMALASFAIGYLCGSFLTAEVVSRRFGKKSAFEVGLGNPGMANMGSVYGVRAAAITLAGDLVKVIVAFLIARTIFASQADLAGLYACVGATFGHVFPAWHRFRGGKGVATTGAAIVLTSPVLGGVALIAGLLVVLFGGYLCLGAIAIPAIWLVLQLVWGDLPHVIAGLALLGVALFCHLGPALDIRTGKTKKASLSEKFLAKLSKRKD